MLNYHDSAGAIEGVGIGENCNIRRIGSGEAESYPWDTCNELET